MKKLIALTLVLCMVSMLCLSASAGSHYEYDNQLSSIGMELTSALYIYSNGSGGVNVGGITRVETGSSPAYTSFTMYSEVSYYDYSGLHSQDAELFVNNVSSQNAYFIPENIIEYTGTNAGLLFAYHDGWATVGNTEILRAEVTQSVGTDYPLSIAPEINELLY